MKRRPNFTYRVIVGLMIGSAPTAISAQQADPIASPATPQDLPLEDDLAAGSEDIYAGDEIIVTGRAPPGQVAGDVEPELQLSPGDIRAYGVSTVGELLTELEPQTRSGAGRDGGSPVVLLNGLRISGFSEVRDLPAEAILRVDILPEEAALAYGYRADQRVVNIVLRPRFKSITGELTGRVPTQGGNSTVEAEAGLLRIRNARRLTVDLEYEHESNILESERGLVSARAGSRPFDTIGNITGVDGAADEIDPTLSALAGAPVTIAGVPISAAGGAPALGDFVAGANNRNVTDITPFRTLRPARDHFQANAVYNQAIFGDVSATVNLEVQANDSLALLGPAGVTLTLPETSPFSPFAAPVQLYRYAPGDPLRRDGKDWTGTAGLVLNGNFSTDWRWSVTGNYNRSETDTRTERGADVGALQAAVTGGQVNPFGDLASLGSLGRSVDTAHSVSSQEGIDGLVAGPAFRLPAGKATVNLRLRANSNNLNSESVRSGNRQTLSTGRDVFNARANINVPIASARDDFLPVLGQLSVNGNVEVEKVSDFGTLTTYGGGVNWTPVRPLRLLVSYSRDEGAPSQQQLANPVVVTPNVSVFDYTRGETVDINRIDGGNPTLFADQRDTIKAGINYNPFDDPDVTLSADYVRSKIRNQASGFPAATAEIEAAFPGRFIRDTDGRLISIDNRPVNFASRDRQELRWGINFSKRVTTAAQRRAAEARANGEDPYAGRRRRRDEAEHATPPADASAVPETGETSANAATDARPEREPRERGGEGRRSGGEGGRGGGGGRGSGGRSGGDGGRIQFSLYHTWRLEESILIRPGVPRLDLLNGSATGNNGGQPRHEVEARGGYSIDGIGFRLNADYRSATFVDGGANGGQRLDFGDLATFDLRLYANLGNQRSLVRKYPFLRGSRVTLSVNNLFDAQQRVTDATGTVPISYQPGYVDPLGRVVRISFRKLFF